MIIADPGDFAGGMQRARGSMRLTGGQSHHPGDADKAGLRTALLGRQGRFQRADIGIEMGVLGTVERGIGKPPGRYYPFICMNFTATSLLCQVAQLLLCSAKDSGTTRDPLQQAASKNTNVEVCFVSLARALCKKQGRIYRYSGSRECVCSSHSRPRPRETSNEAFRSGVDGSSREREVRSERAVPSFVTNFASMPDVIRQAALDVKQSRDAQLAEQVTIGWLR